MASRASTGERSKGINEPPAIRSLKPRKERYDVAVASFDDDDRPVPGLQLRIYPSGAKVFQYRYQLGGSVRRMTLGTFDAVSLKSAREQHHAAAKLVARKVDPIDQEHEKQEAAGREKARNAAEITVEALCEEFIEQELKEHRKDPAQAERILRAEIIPKWKGRKAKDIKRRDAVLLVRGIKARAPVGANRTAALLVQLFRFAADEGHLDSNPLAGLRRPTKEKQRERKLDPDEIRTLWLGLDERVSSQPGGSLKKGREDKRGTKAEPQLTRQIVLALKLLLVTAQRRGEIAKARWSELDLDGKRWTIPKDHTKNGREHIVPLSKLAIELLKELRTLAKDSAYVLPTTQRKGRADAPITEKAITRAAARNQCGLEHWTAHDLRRTAATHMNRIDVDAIIVERVLNHLLPPMMQTYNRHDYFAKMTDAIDRWDAELRRIVAGKSNIVELSKRAAR